MARYRKFLDVDVLTAARQRMRHVYDIFDTPVVCFSGGKDSLTVLRLAREVAEERGQLPVEALFRDEEVIPESVIRYVEQHMDLPWLRLRYFALRSRGTQFVLGRSNYYVQWDPTRRHIRPMPAYAITQPASMPVFDANAADQFTVEHYKGKVAFLTGVRAAESITRYRSCVNKLNESYVVSSKHPRMKLCKVIYDWSENDVLKFLHDTGGWCPLYDAQHLAGERFRVSTPLHSEAAKRIGFLKKTSPLFYDQLLALFPETAMQERYWAELDRDRLQLQYALSFEGLERYLAEIDDDEKRELATTMYLSAKGRALKDPEGYPPVWIYEWLAGGAYYQECMALRPAHRPIWKAKQAALEAKLRKTLPAEPGPAAPRRAAPCLTKPSAAMPAGVDSSAKDMP